MYAVIDLETTGTRTSWHDRVVEVAVVRLDERGRVTDEWCSLVNPDRDLGPQHIHGIAAAEARRAPRFADVAGRLVELLTGHTLVAHNLVFDAQFLAAEFAKLGLDVPVGADRGLCKMRLAGHLLPGAGRSLRACRAAAGLPEHRAHSALHDARAAGELLAGYLSAVGTPPPWRSVVDAAARDHWPVLPPSTVSEVTRRHPENREPHFLTRLIDRLPRLENPRADAYLEILDRALLDRHISATEADDLVTTADRLGLARADVEKLHQQYLAALAALALEDGVVTTDEREDLCGVALLVGLPESAVDEALSNPCDPVEKWQLRPGDLVVFTGEMSPARDVWELEAIAAGLAVGGNVTKKTRLLVAADTDSLSGKAKKARAYGIPIVHPSAYRRMLATGLRTPSAA